MTTNRRGFFALVGKVLALAVVAPAALDVFTQDPGRLTLALETTELRFKRYDGANILINGVKHEIDPNSPDFMDIPIHYNCRCLDAPGARCEFLKWSEDDDYQGVKLEGSLL